MTKRSVVLTLEDGFHTVVSGRLHVICLGIDAALTIEQRMKQPRFFERDGLSIQGRNFLKNRKDIKEIYWSQHDSK